jgi:hypothetical protein
MKKQLFVAIAVLSVAPFVTAQERPAEPPPPEREQVPFTETVPAEAPSTKGWTGVEFGEKFHWHAPLPISDLLMQHVALNSVCAADREVCSFTLRAEQWLDASSERLMLRYVIQSHDGKRVEGYAFATTKPESYTYFRFRNGSWQKLTKGSTSAVVEGTFVAVLWDYILEWKETGKKKPAPKRGNPPIIG